MEKTHRSVYILVILWLLLCAIFFMWGTYSLTIVLDLPNWQQQAQSKTIDPLIPVLYFGYLMSTIVWYVFSFLFLLFTYGTIIKRGWVWTTGVILTTIFLAVFGLMLASFMVTAYLFPDNFSILGLITVVLCTLIDLGIVFFLTRPPVKQHFGIQTRAGSLIDEEDGKISDVF